MATIVHSDVDPTEIVTHFQQRSSPLASRLRALVFMSAQVLRASVKNITQNLHKCSYLSILESHVANRDVIESKAIARFQQILLGGMALMHPISLMCYIRATGFQAYANTRHSTRLAAVCHMLR